MVSVVRSRGFAAPAGPWPQGKKAWRLFWDSGILEPRQVATGRL